MRDFEPAYTRYALAPILPRGAALGIDLLSCTFLGQLIEAIAFGTIEGGIIGYSIFTGLWFLFRVLVVNKSGGQSFGRWLMSLRTIDGEYGKTASISALFWREVLLLISLLFLINTATSTLVVFTWLPLAADALFAQVDTQKRQTFHDRVSGTIVIYTRKGFDLDRKIMGLFGQASRIYREEIKGTDVFQTPKPSSRRSAPRNRDNFTRDMYDATPPRRPSRDRRRRPRER
jgi:uncharacterized RDD family membrane protein YckC